MAPGSPRDRQQVAFLLVLLASPLVPIIMRLSYLSVWPMLMSELMPRRGEILDREGMTLVWTSDADPRTRSTVACLEPFQALVGRVTHGLGVAGLEELNDAKLRSGRNVTTSLSLRISEQMNHCLRKALQESAGLDWVAAMTMNARSGQVIGLAFESSNTSSRENPLLRAIEPGSTLKPFVVAAALEESIVDERSVLDVTNGRILREEVVDGSPELIPLDHVIALSNSTGAWVLADSLGLERLLNWYENFGLLGGSSGIFTASGRCTPAYGLRPLAQGQSLQTPPAQLLAAGCALVNGGILRTPTLSASVDGLESCSLLAEGTSRSLRRMLLAVTTYGTAEGIHNDDWPIIGKTGTVDRSDDAWNPIPPKALALFMGFVPPHEPAVAVLVIVQAPQETGIHGGGVASSIGASVLGFHRSEF